MRDADLSIEQLRKLLASLRPKLGYVRKLKARMVQRQFPESDRMLRDAAIAEAGLAALLAEVETYLSYKDRVPDAFR